MNGKTVFITECASGIGEASALYFLERGWNVVATARRVEDLGDWALADRCLPMALDLSSELSIRAAVGNALAWFGGIDVFVNNTDNVFGAAAMLRNMAPPMRARHRGVMVNVSSVGEAAFEGLCESMRFEMAMHGVKVKLVEAGRGPEVAAAIFHAATDGFSKLRYPSPRCLSARAMPLTIKPRLEYSASTMQSHAARTAPDYRLQASLTL
jgi:NAD(P)-dependent dehydrogenase (short-subunit alcohol dehydrogenase family)